MDKILTYTLQKDDLETTAGGLVNLVLKNCVKVTGHEISSAKYIPDGITVDGNPVHVKDRMQPGQTIRVVLPEEIPVEYAQIRQEMHTLAQDGQSSAAGTAAKVPGQMRGVRKPLQVVIPAEGPLDILYEDEDIVALNKSAGEVVHPGPGHHCDTLANYLAGYYAAKGQQSVCRVAGRLDKETSGVILFARNRAGCARLFRQRQDGRMYRTYLALAAGRFERKSGTIDLPMKKVPGVLMKMQTTAPDDPEGMHAVTHYEVLGCANTCALQNAAAQNTQISGVFGDRCISLLRVRIETGRTHQIRVQMAAIGHPLLGDTLYGPDIKEKPKMKSMEQGNSRAMLHGLCLHLQQPFTGRVLDIQAPPAQDFLQILRSVNGLEWLD